ncbi:MAG TPA: hypothetical protein VF251_05555 [Pyrinomonadaceae bacterium]
MKKFVQELVVLVMIAAATGGAFAQKPRDKGRPPKDPGKVVEPGKRPTPPPQNTNRPKPPDNKKKP